MRKATYEALCLAGTVVALSLGMANRIRIGPPPDASAHLERVRDVARSVTGEVRGMIVRQGQVPRQAFEMLRPNVLEARTYTDLSTNLHYSVLLVHCGDITDMGAHYPPSCYPGAGMKLAEARPMPLELAGVLLNGFEYEFRPMREGDREPIRIWNCMFLPRGTTTHEPTDLRRSARVDDLRYYGAGQIQVLVRATASEADRLACYRQALSQYAPVIAQMLSDPHAPTFADNRQTEPGLPRP